MACAYVLQVDHRVHQMGEGVSSDGLRVSSISIAAVFLLSSVVLEGLSPLPLGLIVVCQQLVGFRFCSGSGAFCYSSTTTRLNLV